MPRRTGVVVFAVALAVVALAWMGQRHIAGAQVVAKEVLTIEIDSVLVDDVKLPVPIGHDEFDVTLTPGTESNTLELEATDVEGFAFHATYTAQGPK